MGPTGNTSRILQIHPSRRCNLRCLHCYSSSGPEVSDSLELRLLTGAIGTAAKHGYTVLGVSGGEPMLYPELPALLDHAHMHGMTTTVTSNGMLLDVPRLELLIGRADLLAISLDGMPESHNRMRASARAFDTMQSKLEGVRQSGIPFGFIFTLTQHNVHELDWVAKFALAQGAKLLQIHPLEGVGRARTELRDATPDWLEASFAYVEAARVQALVGEEMFVQLDVAHRDALLRQPERIFATGMADNAQDLPLAELISPLVIETDGTVVPLEYGFPKNYALGNLHDAPLEELQAVWRRETFAKFLEVCRGTYAAISEHPEQSFVNWYEKVNYQAVNVVPNAPNAQASLKGT
jgi:Fe-coproporphyrin III synthase